MIIPLLMILHKQTNNNEEGALGNAPARVHEGDKLPVGRAQPCRYNSIML